MRGRQDARRTYAVASTRDKNKWPFSTGSIWNTPIGSGAVYSVFHGTTDNVGGENPLPGIQSPGIRLSGGQPIVGNGVGCAIDRNYIVHAVSTDPLITVYKQTGWGAGTRCLSTTLAKPYFSASTPWQINFPVNQIIPDMVGSKTDNCSIAIVQPDGSMIHGNVSARCAAGGPLYMTPFWQFATVDSLVLAADATITSTGMYGGHGGSGLSAYGGCLMPGDLTGPGPIRHALSMDINGAEYLYYDSATKGFVWPAVTNDGGAPSTDYYGGYHGHYPALRMGSLLAIPPSVTEASLGLTLRGVKKIFHALQDYGVYIVDDTGWSSADLNISDQADIEYQDYYGYSLSAGHPAFPQYITQPEHDELLACYGALQVISNNSATSVGGGGTPRVPPAPPIAGP